MNDTNTLRPEISVVVTAYNEGGNTRIVVEQAMKAMEERGLAGYEILIVNDGSVDETRQIADDLAKLDKRIKALHHEKNMGFGAALKTGYAASTGKYVTLLPGDGEVSPQMPIKLLDAIGDGDIMVSDRIRSNVKLPFYRAILTYGLQKLMRTMFGFDQTGLEGVYLIRGDLLRGFRLVSNTGMVNLEILMRAVSAGKTIKRGVTMDVLPRLSGSSKIANLRGTLKTLVEMFKLKAKLVMEKRP